MPDKRKSTPDALKKDIARLRERIAELESADNRRIEALKESEEKLRQITDAAFDGISLTENGVFLEVSSKFAGIFGYHADEMTGMSVSQLLAPSCLEDVINKMQEGYDRPYECTCVKKDGSPFAVEVCGKSFTRGGRELRVTAIRDITARKQAEEALRESEEKFKNLTEESLVGVYLFQDNIFRYVNPRMAEIFGYAVHELVGKKGPADLTHPDDRPLQQEHIRKRLTGEVRSIQYTFRGVRKDGGHPFIEVFGSSTTYRGRPAIVGTLLDVTDRLQYEQALQESEARFRAIFENSIDAVGVSTAGRHVMVNPAYLAMFGYRSADDLEGKPILDLIAPAERTRISEFMAMRGSGSAPSSYQTRGRKMDGTEFDMEAHVFTYEQNGIRYTVPVLRDITERNRAQRALGESEEKYRMVVENANETIVVAQDGLLRFVNRKFEELMGYSRSEAESAPFTDFIHPEDRSRVSDGHRKRLKGELAPVDQYDFKVITKSGEVLWVEIKGAVITWQGRPATVNFITDITERKRLEAMIARQEKLESVGILAGGIAHDFNNILTAIIGNISLAKLRVSQGKETGHHLTEAEKACLRARDLTQQLLTFSKGGAPVKRTLSLPDLVREAAGFAVSGTSVRCEFTLPDDLWPIEADEGQISQVFHNLVINSVQAMPQGGTIRISAENIIPGQGRMQADDLGRSVAITLSDEGQGIPEEHLQKIFDPYFTTKQAGSGLGLAVTYSIIKKHGGRIDVQSPREGGTSFRIVLPASDRKPEFADRNEERLSTGSGRVLVMDDEATVRNVTSAILREGGYDVDAVASGDEAVALYKKARQEARPYDAVIMDLTIPGGMGGKDTMAKLREIDPAVKGIVSSGYSNDPVLARYREYGFRAMITKPFSSTDLCRVVQDVISRKGK